MQSAHISSRYLGQKIWGIRASLSNSARNEKNPIRELNALVLHVRKLSHFYGISTQRAIKHNNTSIVLWLLTRVKFHNHSWYENSVIPSIFSTFSASYYMVITTPYKHCGLRMNWQRPRFWPILVAHTIKGAVWFKFSVHVYILPVCAFIYYLTFLIVVTYCCGQEWSILG